MSPWVPIGIEGAAGTSSGSWGLFVHFMDVGALASYRFSTDGAEQEGSADGDVPVEPTPTVSLKQVFSPGLFLTHGFKKAPLSIAIGASFSPELRTVADVGDAQGNPKRAKAWRWGVALAMDLPLFP